MNETRANSDGVQSSKVQIREDNFGFLLGKTTGPSTPIRRFTWKNSNGVTVQMISYGATITAIQIPDNGGVMDDVVMGFDDMQGYLTASNPYFGATVGRVANRIGNATIDVDGTRYEVNANLAGRHQLHGGFRGFDKMNWECNVRGSKVVFSYDSADGEEGYPGNVLVNQTCELTDDNKFLIDFKATSTKPTVVNLTNHSYFNLAGHDKGSTELYKHVVSINADRITDVDADFIPTGKLLPVANTIYDLQTPKILAEVITKVPVVGGYDHNFCVNRGAEQGDAFIARVTHPPSGRTLEVYSNQPGVQFYTSNGIPEKEKREQVTSQRIIGKGGSRYYKHGSLCLETQNYPDAVNHKNFPNAILYPGTTYHHTITYRFSFK